MHTVRARQTVDRAELGCRQASGPGVCGAVACSKGREQDQGRQTYTFSTDEPNVFWGL